MAGTGGIAPATGTIRLLDLLSGLSLVSDLGMGHPPEEALRASVVATGLARALDLPERDVGDVLYTTLLQHVGCTGFAHETAALLGGDDVAVNAAGSRTNFADRREMLTTFLPALVGDGGPARWVRLTFAAIRSGSEMGAGLARADCEVAAGTAERLGLGEQVQTSLRQVFEWWNGKGDPNRVSGDDLELPGRIAQVASTAMLFHHLGGPELAFDALRRRAGTILDPALVGRFEHAGPDLLAHATSGDPAALLLDAEPAPVRRVLPPQLAEVARAFGELADLKSPWLHGHSTAVGRLAQEAGRILGVEEARDDRLLVAGLLHDIGRVGVASGIWDADGELTSGQREQVELHAYHSERILGRSEALHPIAHLAGMHHERCDGSGYHRGSRVGALPPAGRVLAAADVLVALRQDRPHRAALEVDQATAVLAAEASAGRLDADAVTAVLTAVGERGRSVRRVWPAGLTDRQVEVLRLLATGSSNRQIAEQLTVSRRTAEHHVQDVYAKIGVSSRAGAAMFAMRHDLVAPAAEDG